MVEERFSGREIGGQRAEKYSSSHLGRLMMTFLPVNGNLVVTSPVPLAHQLIFIYFYIIYLFLYLYYIYLPTLNVHYKES